MNAITVYSLLRKYIADTVDAHTGYIKGKNVIIKKTEVDDKTKDVKLTLAYTPDPTTEQPSPKQVLTDINISAGFNAYETFRRNLYDIQSLDYANYSYEKWLKDLTDACDGQFIYLDQSKKHLVYDEATGDVKKDENGQPVMAYQFGDDIEENTVLHLDEDKKVTAGKIQTMYAQLLWNEPQDDVDEVNSVNWGWRQESGGKVLVSSAIGVGGSGNEIKNSPHSILLGDTNVIEGGQINFAYGYSNLIGMPSGNPSKLMNNTVFGSGHTLYKSGLVAINNNFVAGSGHGIDGADSCFIAGKDNSIPAGYGCVVLGEGLSTGDNVISAMTIVGQNNDPSAMEANAKFIVGNGVDENNLENVFQAGGSTNVVGGCFIQIGNTKINETQLQALLALLS